MTSYNPPRALFLALFLTISNILLSGEADSTQRGLMIGIHAGALFADNNDAFYYNGDPNKSNSIIRILNIESYQRQIFEQYNDYINKNKIYYPTKVSYTPAVLFGLDIAYRINSSSNIVCAFQFAQVQASAQFSAELATPSPDIIDGIKMVYGEINAKESRFDIELAYEHIFPQQSGFNPLIGLGGNFNALKVLEHKMNLGSINASLTNTSDTYYKNKQPGGTGFGFFGEIGIETLIKERYTTQLIYKASKKQIALIADKTMSFTNEIFLRVYF